MSQCSICNKDIVYKCEYCGSDYCFDHQHPESHKCAYTLKTPQPNVQPDYQTDKPSQIRKTNRKKTIAAITILTIVTILIAASIFCIYNPMQLTPQENKPTTNPQPTYPSITTETQQPIDPELINYTLDLINTDRKEHGLQNVTLSTINSAQISAEELLKGKYISHWDQDGNKPYMRYTKAGGQHAVSENAAWQVYTGTTNRHINVKDTIKKLEYFMMYDDAESDWGHRDNILNPFHNKVNIGIAYDNNNIFLVQHFENDYIVWNTRNYKGEQLTLEGTLTKPELTIEGIMIFYDQPQKLTINELSQAPYNAGYNAGTYIAAVFPPAPKGQYYDWSKISVKGIEAKTWIQEDNDFKIIFSLREAITAKGVYTIYLLAGDSTAKALTSYSIWIT